MDVRCLFSFGEQQQQLFDFQENKFVWTSLWMFEQQRNAVHEKPQHFGHGELAGIEIGLKIGERQVGREK